ncbi:hypothetical protein AVEN_167054-1 [Araneus ventricosus]|uniref:Uncharacterized protein n=1 Tax=Araneus ventricosus TaxID=182803 RepID=A0A4Y2CPT8_ARAVE|nr:hypothetical protein AVEN_167054-1 [Araneus ventricosus]
MGSKVLEMLIDETDYALILIFKRIQVILDGKASLFTNTMEVQEFIDLLQFNALPRRALSDVVTNSATISVVDELIRSIRRIITLGISVELSISKGTAHHIIHKKLGYGKVCALWVNKHLSKNQKTARWELDPQANPGVSALKPSTPFLRSGISVNGHYL